MNPAVQRALMALEISAQAFHDVELMCRPHGDDHPIGGGCIVETREEVIVVTRAGTARRFAYVRSFFILLMCLGIGGCSSAEASRNFYLAVAGEYAGYVGADTKLTNDQKERRYTTLEVERERLKSHGLDVPCVVPTVTAQIAGEVAR